MRRWLAGDEVVLGPKVDDRLPAGVRWSFRLKPGMRGKVVGVAFENKRKHKQWVIVDVSSKTGSSLGRVRLPSSWLLRPEETPPA